MKKSLPQKKQLLQLIKSGSLLPLATKNYPSRGQTAVQELYQTKIGKLFLKKASDTNHRNCQIDKAAGSLAEREYWAFKLAKKIGLKVPELALIDKKITIQIWLDYPDGNQYSTSENAMTFKEKNVFECAVFDWVTGQIDRHDANYLYNFADEEIILIDSAFSFLKYTGAIPDYLKLYEARYERILHRKIISDTKKKLERLSTASLKKIVPLRDPDQRTAFISRQQQIKKIQSIKEVIQLYRGIK